MAMTTASILIPAHNEAEYLPACLEALLASDPVARVEVIVIANGCTDNTVALAEGFADRFAALGWALEVLDLPTGGKLAALNAGEAVARGQALIYVDADVAVTPPLVAQLAKALARPDAAYASGRPVVTGGQDWLTRAFTRFWLKTPFMTRGVPGFGVFAMNRAGRDRWGDWPDIISDDTFARLHFASEERMSVPAGYHWPMIEGFSRLVQVRRRQDNGVAEIATLYPELLGNDDEGGGATPLWQRALRDPVGMAAYCAVRLAGRLPVYRNAKRWARGR